ncbi:MAG: 2-oxoacid:ferredoxin oxidoreductase subunit beta, partial [Gemmatimonadales bacterium]
KFTREHEVEISAADFVPLRHEITAPLTNEAVSTVTMHDGSVVRFRKTHEGYDPTNRESAYAHMRACQQRQEVATGLLFIDETGADMHAVLKTSVTPLVDLTHDQLCPGNAALQALMERYR